MRALMGCALFGVMLVAANLHADDKKEKFDAKKLIGKWEPAELPKGAKAVIEMTKDGKVKLSFEFGGKMENTTGTYKLEGDKLTVTLLKEGKDDRDVMTVTKLTDEELTTKDAKGKIETLKKIAAKK